MQRSAFAISIIEFLLGATPRQRCEGSGFAPKRRNCAILLLTVCLGLFCMHWSATGAVHYVNVENSAPVSPYADWATAANVIQDAVDVAQAGDEIVVTNGLYELGGKPALNGQLTNRVTVLRPVVIRSVNGPDVTTIRGNQVPETRYDFAAVRCVYLADGSLLTGFTLTNGATLGRGGGSADNFGGGVRGESATWTSNSAVVSNCVLSGNAAWLGGGGAALATLKRCTIVSNVTDFDGGGGTQARMENCFVQGNQARSGGGANGSMLHNCAVTSNSAMWGGGVVRSVVLNCTLTGNSASTAGGAGASYLTNCVVYYNVAFVYDSNYENYPTGALSFCCTTPLPFRGVGNIEDEPQLADAFHLSAISPCRSVGLAQIAQGRDIDGEAWTNRPSIGCDEYHLVGLGPLTVSIRADHTNVVPGYPVKFQLEVAGDRQAIRWDFGDGTVLSNQLSAVHRWTNAGDYMVVVRAFNASFPAGVSVELRVRVEDVTHYVALDSTNPVPPYRSWATAATTIQDAVDAASVVGALILVTNGVYQSGGKTVEGVSNRVVVPRPFRLESVNGPEVTVITGQDGTGALSDETPVRCVLLSDGAYLSGFTVTRGIHDNAAGVWCETYNTVVSNCVIIENSAFWSAGGVAGGTLFNCSIRGNYALNGAGVYSTVLHNCVLNENSGEPAAFAALYHCTLIGNWRGAFGCSLYNCIAFYNGFVEYEYDDDAENYSACDLYYSCAAPLAPGPGNIDTPPLLASASHLSAASPCRGAGNRLYGHGLDIDGESYADPPSMGCDEFHNSALTGALTVGMQPVPSDILPGDSVMFVAHIAGPARSSHWDFGDGTVVSNQLRLSHRYPEEGTYRVTLWANNEGHPEGVTNTVTIRVFQPIHYVSVDSVNPVSPYSSWATAARTIQDAVDVATVPRSWVIVSNGVYETGGRVAVGSTTNRLVITNQIVVRSVNGPAVTAIRGYQVPGTTNGDSAIRCAWLNNFGSLTGFTLADGATKLEGASPADGSGGGIYGEIGLVTNCIITGNSASSGGGVGNAGVNASLSLYNCTLTTNSAGTGGGAYRAWLENCILANNSAQFGGGASDAMLFNCLLRRNSASTDGGGSYGGQVYNCTITENSAGGAGGGVSRSGGDNSIIYYNTATIDPEHNLSFLFYCCVTPLPEFPGEGNFTNAPLFVDWAGGDLHLQRDSPCINSGYGSWANVLTLEGLDGQPRVVGGLIDVGAYEFQNPVSTLPYAWLYQYGLPISGSVNQLDPDGDKLTNWEEWWAGTNPADSSSNLSFLSIERRCNGMAVAWRASPYRTYRLERGTNSMDFTPIWSGYWGSTDEVITYVDSGAPGVGPVFYRVGVPK